MAVEVTVRKWGNSKGAIFPKSFLEKENIRDGDKILIQRVRQADLSDVFGTLKGGKMSGQQFKDMVRKGWGK